MIASLNRTLFDLLAAPAAPQGGCLPTLRIVAEWAVFAGPTTLVLLWVLGVHQERRTAIAACLAALLALGIAHVASALIFEPRPFMDGLAPNRLDHAPDSGFPSDHATLLFGLAFGLLAFRPARIPSLWIGPLVLGLAAGWARVALGVHYPFDILGAAAIATAAARLVATRWGRALATSLTMAGERIHGALLPHHRGAATSRSQPSSDWR